MENSPPTPPPRRGRAALALLLALLAQAASPQPAAAQLNTEPGAIVIEDLLEEPILLTIKDAAAVYSSVRSPRRLGIIPAGREVKLVAVTDRAYRVRGEALHGGVVGWIRPDDLDADPEMIESITKLYERQILVQEMIRERQVALGMTNKEVEASLGKPTRKSSELTRAGRKDSYEYSIFERVPHQTLVQDQTGRVFTRTTYVEVETGTLKITFDNEVVDSISEDQGRPLGGGEVRIVPGPIFFHR
jgi:hypothetical protein